MNLQNLSNNQQLIYLEYKEILSLLVSYNLISLDTNIRLYFRSKYTSKGVIIYNKELNRYNIILRLSKVKKSYPFIIAHELGHLIYNKKYSNNRFGYVKLKKNSRAKRANILWKNYKKEIFSDLIACKVLLKMGYSLNSISHMLLLIYDIDTMEEYNDIKDKNSKTHPNLETRMNIIIDYMHKKSCRYMKLPSEVDIREYSKFCKFFW